MQSAVLTPSAPPSCTDDDFITQIMELREIIKSQRMRAVQNWDDCAPKEETENKERGVVGKFTEQLSNGQL